jgi:glycosyltransferase involved in cell wall biosynthesis
METQGVSRNEAMSSGLVPITNAVATIPEFVDDSCGILAPGGDAEAMAHGIARLLRSRIHLHLFRAMPLAESAINAASLR